MELETEITRDLSSMSMKWNKVFFTTKYSFISGLINKEYVKKEELIFKGHDDALEYFNKLCDLMDAN